MSNILSFYFPDGIWRGEGEEATRTDSAQVDFEIMDKDIDNVDIYLFKKDRRGKVIREEWKLSKLIEYANSGKKSLEFLYQYKGFPLP